MSIRNVRTWIFQLLRKNLNDKCASNGNHVVVMDDKGPICKRKEHSCLYKL